MIKARYKHGKNIKKVLEQLHEEVNTAAEERIKAYAEELVAQLKKLLASDIPYFEAEEENRRRRSNKESPRSKVIKSIQEYIDALQIIEEREKGKYKVRIEIKKGRSDGGIDLNIVALALEYGSAGHDMTPRSRWRTLISDSLRAEKGLVKDIEKIITERVRDL